MTKDKNKPLRPRTLSRVAAVQVLFQWDQDKNCPLNTIVEQFLIYRNHNKCTWSDYEDGKSVIPDIKLFRAIIENFAHHISDIDEAIIKVLPHDWPLNRIDPLVRSVFRSAAAELIAHQTEPPSNVIINEYIDVTHAFCEGDEPSLVNGIVNSLSKNLRIFKANSVD